ncbi:MAG: PHB depolymerase family esterase [Amphiplicatus sp.]
MMTNFLIACGALCAAFGASAPAQANAAQTGEIERTAKLVDIVGETGARNFESALPSDHDIEFELFVPETYDASKPAGVFVFVSPSPAGEIPRDWKKIFEAKNLIWVSVAKSGNKRPTMRRIVETIVSPAYVTQNYAIDPKRIYVAGFSGGGRIASIVAPNYPDMFAGAVYICGVNPWEKEQPAALEQMRANRYAFVSGSEDFNLRETREAHGEYKKAKLDALLQVSPGAGHDMPDARKLEAVIDYLDGLGQS